MGCPRILFYHRFAENSSRAMSSALFEEQIVYLKKHFNIVPLRSITEPLAKGDRLPKNAVALTVDDGYTDFLQIAYPVIKKHNVPMTVFLVSRFAINDEWLWFDRVRFVCENSSKPSVSFQTPQREFDLRLLSKEDRERAWDELCSWCLRRTTEERQAVVAAFENAASVEVPVSPTEEYRSLSKMEITSMDSDLVEIGAHTQSHVILSSCPRAEQEGEIAGSKEELEKFLGRKINHFAYPNGQPADFDEVSCSVVEKSGFLGGVTVRPALIDEHTDRFSIPRMCASFDMNVFRNEVNGLAHLKEIVTGRAENKKRTRSTNY